MSKPVVFAYEGEGVDVAWDRRLCIHFGACTRAEGGVFDIAEDPWCRPDRAPVETVEAIVRQCPSGALTARRKDGSATETPPSENTVTVNPDGPLFVYGDIAIDGAPDDMPGVRLRAALCRCGLSRNKPFCDNSHVEGGFRAAGAIAESSGEAAGRGGPLSVKPARNGPLLLAGSVAIVAGDGRTRWTGDKAALCRCGHSGNKPFCDGSHKDAGFESG